MLVRFGNNWIQKIPLTAKLDSAYGLVQFWLSSEFFSSIYFQIGRHIVRLHILIICILRNTHQKASSYNFLSQMSSSQSGDQTLFFTCEKKKWYDQSEATEVCEFRVKIPAFYRHLKLTGPLQLLRRHSMRKVSSEEFFLQKKWETSRKLKWNSFVCFIVDEENYRAPAKQQQKTKNRTRRKIDR